MKKGLILFIMLIAVFLTACSVGQNTGMFKYKTEYYDTFDTIIRLVINAKSESEAYDISEYIHSELIRLHRLYDAYNDYDGVLNVKFINDNAGKGPVSVDQDLFDLIAFSKLNYESISDRTDISMGAVLNEWSEARKGHSMGNDAFHSHDDEQRHENQEPILPDMEVLREKNDFTGMNNIILDYDKGTVEITNENTRIDVGAVAKGFAVELVANKSKDRGITSVIINAGGNVRTIGVPANGNEFWKIGIENPLSGGAEDTNVLAITQIKEGAVVSSGDYQRYYVVDGVKYHHLIDPDTLMPADKFHSVTVVGVDSGLCDFLSTALFMTDYDTGVELINEIEGYEAIWVNLDGSVVMTDALVDSTSVIVKN